MSRSWVDVWPPPPTQAAGSIRSSISNGSGAVSVTSSNNPWAEVRPMTRASTTEAEPADGWSRSPYDLVHL
eukprot:6456821-Amphidinium_carterae.1